MSLTAAEQAAFDHLAAQPGPVTRASPPSPDGWMALTHHGGGEGAEPATVRFRKTRAFTGCQLHQVESTNRGGRPQRMLVRTRQRPDGTWVAEPIGGAGGAGPHRARPWVNFAATWNADLFAAGGNVTGHDAEAACLIRLTFADGTATEDTAGNGVVLFFASPGVNFPARAEILDTTGNALADYDEFAEFADPE